MDIKELKEIIKDLPDTMPIEFTTFSMYMTRDITVEVYEKDGRWVNEDTLVIAANNV